MVLLVFYNCITVLFVCVFITYFVVIRLFICFMPVFVFVFCGNKEASPAVVFCFRVPLFLCCARFLFCAMFVSVVQNARFNLLLPRFCCVGRGVIHFCVPFGANTFLRKKNKKIEFQKKEKFFRNRILIF